MSPRLPVRGRSWLAVLAGGVVLAVVAAPGPVPASTRTSSSAVRRWVARYDGPGHYLDLATAAVVTPDGRTVIVTGSSFGRGTNYDYATIAYDMQTGAQEWVARYDGPNHDDDQARAVAVTPDGSTVIVTGSSPGLGTGSDYATIAYDTQTGARKWLKRYDGPAHGSDAGTAVAVTPDARMVIVTGQSRGRTSGLDYATVAYDTATGAQEWVARYDGAAHGNDDAGALTITRDGGTVVVTGSSHASTRSTEIATVAYEATTGARKWVARYGGPEHAGATGTAVVVTPDALTVIVAGERNDATRHADYVTVAYALTTGAQTWLSRYDGPAHGPDIAHALAVTPDGATVVVTGVSAGTSTDYGYATLGYDTVTGAKRWIARDDNACGGANAVAITPDGSTAFVTGQPNGVTLAIDISTGAKRPFGRYKGDVAVAASISPDDSTLIVFGDRTTRTGSSDYTTIAYDIATAPARP